VASAPIDPTPLDAPCEPLSGDSHAHLRERLADWCRSELGYNVEIRPVAGPAGGWCDTKARAIVVDATGAPNAQLRTLIHEAATRWASTTARTRASAPRSSSRASFSAPVA
jgi:hypothetical protein